MMYLVYALLTLHMFVGIFLIGLILLQRGRGGGLAGAFGGMGGQSAFGTKAGDIFTRITIGVAVFWILLACICILVVSAATKGRFKPGAAGADAVIKAPATDNDDAKGDDAKDGKKPDAGAAADGSIVPPSPGKLVSPSEQPEGGEKKPKDKKDEGAAATKQPDNAGAKPAAANPDAPAEAKEKGQDQSATPESSDTKKPD